MFNEKLGEECSRAGQLKWKLKLFTEALADYQDALNLKTSIFGSDSTEVADCLTKISCV